MDVRRSITCGFWTDEWVESMNTEQKLLFLYLLTNPQSNILGIYKISINRISFETGLSEPKILNHLKAFQSVKKVFYIEGFVIIANHIKHQALNPNMKTNILRDYEDLPNSLKDRINGNTSEGFESLSKSLQTLPKIEIESEREIKIEIEKKKGLNFESSKTLLLSHSDDWYQDIMEANENITDIEKLKLQIEKFLISQKSKAYFPKPIEATKAYFVNWLNTQTKVIAQQPLSDAQILDSMSKRY